MKTYTSTELKSILNLHKKYLKGDSGGARADLSGAYLSGADLLGANLSGADLSGANLSRANLSGAYLSRANLSGANLYGASLSGANLSGANLYGASLSGADLSGANLSGANLSRADLSGANLSMSLGIIPQVILLAAWGVVSDSLCTDLMTYDAESHPDPKAFTKWVKTSECPYINCNVSRACHFFEKRGLWNPRNKPKRPYDLMIRLFEEKGIKFNKAK